MALLGQALLQILQLALIRQAAKPKQVAGLFKIRMIGQFMNIDAAIGKNSTVSIDIANAGVGGDNSFHAFGAGGAGDAGHSLSLKRIGCGSRARTFARNATFFYTRKSAQIPYSLTSRWSRQRRTMPARCSMRSCPESVLGFVLKEGVRGIHPDSF